MNRLTDNDKKWGPFTFSRYSGWKAIRVVFSSNGGEDEPVYNTLILHFYSFILRITLPLVIKSLFHSMNSTVYFWLCRSRCC